MCLFLLFFSKDDPEPRNGADPTFLLLNSPSAASKLAKSMGASDEQIYGFKAQYYKVRFVFLDLVWINQYDRVR